MCTLVICINTCVSLQATLSPQPSVWIGKVMPMRLTCLACGPVVLQRQNKGLEPMAPTLSGILSVKLTLMEIQSTNYVRTTL